MVLRRVLFGVHESASSGEWSHDGHVVGKASFSWPVHVLVHHLTRPKSAEELTRGTYGFVAA